MKVSFLVTYYNQEQFVRQSLESIIKIEKSCQWEILIGDDGSSDHTISIAEEYAKKFPDHIKLYVMPRDLKKKYDPVKRASENRLNLLSKAEGDFFCIMDGDDYYIDSHFVDEAISVFTRDNSVSVVAFGYQDVFVDHSKKNHILSETDSHGYVDRKQYLSSFYIHSGACVYRKMWGKERIAYLKKVGYYDDNDIVINNLNYGTMYSVKRPVYAYRQTGSSIYTSMSEIEKAVLNVQGLDVDLKLIGEEYRGNLLERNAISLLTMFTWKLELRECLGSQKYDQYCEMCRQIDDSYAFRILTFDERSEKDKREIKAIIKKIRCSRIWKACKIQIKYIMRGFVR